MLGLEFDRLDAKGAGIVGLVASPIRDDLLGIFHDGTKSSTACSVFELICTRSKFIPAGEVAGEVERSLSAGGPRF